MKLWPNSPVHIPKYDGMLPFASSASPAASSSPIAINSVTSTNSPTLKLMDATNMVSPQHVPADMDDYVCYTHSVHTYAIYLTSSLIEFDIFYIESEHNARINARTSHTMADTSSSDGLPQHLCPFLGRGYYAVSERMSFSGYILYKLIP